MIDVGQVDDVGQQNGGCIMTVTDNMFIAMRRSPDGHIFFDYDTISGSRQTCEEKLANHGLSNTLWADSNPVVDVVDVRITHKSDNAPWNDQIRA